MQPLVLLLQLAHKAFDRRGRRVDLAEIPHFACPAGFRNRHRVLRLRHVKADVNRAILTRGPPSFAGDRRGFVPGNPRGLKLAKAKGGHPSIHGHSV